MKHTHLRASTLLALLPMAFAAVSGISAPASAQTASVLASQPRTISYQGVLEQNGSLVQDGDYTLHLTLYGDAAGTSPVWQGTYTVHTTNGVFNVPLGSGQYPFPTPKAMDGALWLGVKIGEGAELPLTALSATAYAMNVADGSITAEKMATDYVGSISVNGQKITGTGTGLNFTSASGMALNYDPTRNAIIFSGTGAGTTDGKGTNPLNNSVH
ncbi:MAG TPA: hypothetical protein VFX22_10680, partial [Candidatus Kapabacteria bacterium]|nr:hypothetical protein [Candidatus Kapabacteria bacterium]